MRAMVVDVPQRLCAVSACSSWFYQKLTYECSFTQTLGLPPSTHIWGGAGWKYEIWVPLLSSLLWRSRGITEAGREPQARDQQSTKSRHCVYSRRSGRTVDKASHRMQRKVGLGGE